MGTHKWTIRIITAVSALNIFKLRCFSPQNGPELYLSGTNTAYGSLFILTKFAPEYDAVMA
jgi:hypothetical protein